MSRVRSLAPSLLGRAGVGAFIALLIAGCSSGQQPKDTPEPQEEMPIGFRATVESESESRAGTRAGEQLPGDGELTTPLLKELGFGVYCWYTGSKNVIFTDDKGTNPSAHISSFAQYMLMRDQKVEWKNTSWTYDPPKYWPVDPDDMLTLRAYAPYAGYLKEDNNGMPLLPVVVKADDYHNGTQHDPLWGTGKLVSPSTNEYYPDNPEEPVYPDNKKYGSHYNNITYKMSGDWRDKPSNHDPADTRDGTIDWYFHHGMAKLVFWGLLDDKSLQETARITSIKLTPLYSQGLLDISSPTGNENDKPYWKEQGGDMEVELLEQDLSTSTIRKFDDNETYKGWTMLTEKGLLIIPRDYSLSPMKLTVTIYNESTSSNVTMSTDITRNFQGNTIYSLRMTVSNVLYVEIDLVKSAFTPWTEVSTDHKIYNW